MLTMYHRARFTAELVDEDLIAVVDLCLPNTRSVTNDAERVVAVIAEYVTIGKRQIVYRDTSGQWDGIKVRGEKFNGFVSIGVTERVVAIDVARSLIREGRQWR